MAQLIVYCSILAALIAVGSSLECFVCASTSDAGCTNKAFDSVAMASYTSTNCTYCKKTYSNAWGIEGTVRECTVPCEPEYQDLSSPFGTFISEVACCQDADLCNSASLLAPAAISVVFCLLLALYN